LLNPERVVTDTIRVKRAIRALGPLSVSLVLVAALAAPPATARDLESLRERAQSVADEVTALERRLEDLSGRRQRLGARISRVSQDLAALELEMTRAARAYRAARSAYVQRAVAAYKSGPGTRLGILLSARSLGELLDLAQATGRASELDARALARFDEARAAAALAQEQTDERKQTLLAAETRVRELDAAATAALRERRSVLAELNSEIQALERRARRLAASSARPSQALLELLGPAGPSRGIPPGFASTGVAFEGIASWYGPGFEGNHTASGDIFDSSLFTAASKELPFGTWLYVEHKGRGVVVLINDRGPFIEGRILDLSRAAAHAIGITGLGWIRAEILIKI
jgi:peptidoglycan hydrolase CwlO-like protein